MESVDDFGLTTSKRTAALGNLDAVKAAYELSPLFETRNPRTNANLVHYAAQALSGGAAIIKWAIMEVNAPIVLFSERILVQRGDRVEGNGHTVAMEAVYNRNAEVIEALIDIREAGLVVDLTTPALTGWTPRGFALREKLSFAVTCRRRVRRLKTQGKRRGSLRNRKTTTGYRYIPVTEPCWTLLPSCAAMS